MKNYLYVLIPIVAFLIILTNAFFGHELFASTEQVANKYSVYVHLQPDWNSYSKNIIFEVTNSWYKKNLDSTIETPLDNYNANQLNDLGGKSYVELKHEFSDCEGEWTPILYRKAIDTVRHEIEYIQGAQLSDDPSFSIYPDQENTNYDKQEQEKKLLESYAQFIPICSSNEITSYDFSIKTDNPLVGFDVYFVKSLQERTDFFNEKEGFDYYDEYGCFAQNKQSYSGTCKNVSKNSGLLIVIPDELKPWVTKIKVNLYEAESQV
ncbi:MAG: hypothetical protein ACR2LL_11085 [Nitrosopumilus sp.]|uniref:hypothetical protein n=1 Tax=Nitrosopumilus sp. TaxID=2024843 RepID=UPI00292D8AE3|nr:hypothetical protein [Nitrosopumilus sp.]